MRLAPALRFAAALALCVGPASAQDRPDFLKKAVKGKPVADVSVAPPKQTTATGPDAPACLKTTSTRTDYGAFCDSFDGCVKFCRCACDFDITKWKDKTDPGRVGVATCKYFPQEGKHVIPAASKALLPVPADFQYIDVDAADGERATQGVIDALRRLDTQLASSRTRQDKGYRVRVGSCYRPSEGDSQVECGWVLTSRYMVDVSTWDGPRGHWTWNGDPNHLGLAWPGASPHSAGLACDLILTDKKGNDCFDWRAGVVDEKHPVPTCSIPARQAVGYLADELTSASVGARRLSYEAWHFEWDPDNPPSRCGDRAECDKHWPLSGHN